jgi:ferritin-like metal-binding protein YciE
MPNQPKAQNLRDLFVLKLKALYDVENQLTKALPKMAKAATDEDLQTAFEDHLAETQNHVKRLEEVFGMLDMKPAKITVEAIRGLAEDGDWVAKNLKGSPALNAGLIAAAQYVEHYEIAGYGSVTEWAKLLGEDDIADVLGKTLEEEETADEKLNELALSRINEEAMGEDEGEETDKE